MKIPLSAILPGQPSEACCTCATVLSDVPRYSPQTEKPYPADRRLDCCPRVICGRCIHVSFLVSLVFLTFHAPARQRDGPSRRRLTVSTRRDTGKRPLRLVLPLLPGRQRSVKPPTAGPPRAALIRFRDIQEHHHHHPDSRRRR